jgi:hypothetical protein
MTRHRMSRLLFFVLAALVSVKPAPVHAQATDGIVRAAPDSVLVPIFNRLLPFVSCTEPKVPANLFRWNDARVTQQDCIAEGIPNEKTVVVIFENRVALPCGGAGIVRAPVAFTFVRPRDSADVAKNYYRPYMTLFDSAAAVTGTLSHAWQFAPVPDQVSIGKRLQAVSSFMKLKDKKAGAFLPEHLAHACSPP